MSQQYDFEKESRKEEDSYFEQLFLSIDWATGLGKLCSQENYDPSNFAVDLTVNGIEMPIPVFSAFVEEMVERRVKHELKKLNYRERKDVIEQAIVNRTKNILEQVSTMILENTFDEPN